MPLWGNPLFPAKQYAPPLLEPAGGVQAVAAALAARNAAVPSAGLEQHFADLADLPAFCTVGDAVSAAAALQQLQQLPPQQRTQQFAASAWRAWFNWAGPFGDYAHAAHRLAALLLHVPLDIQQAAKQFANGAAAATADKSIVSPQPCSSEQATAFAQLAVAW